MNPDDNLDPRSYLKQQRPQAGESANWFNSKVFFISPKPTALPIPAMDASQSFTEVTDTYLKVGGGANRKAFQVQVANSFIIFSIFVFCIFPALLAGIGALVHPEWGRTFWYNFFTDLKSGIFLSCLIIIPTFIFLYAIIYYTCYQSQRAQPIIFNRQRREACLIPDSRFPVFQPWETMVAWIGRQANFTGHAIMQQSMLGLVFEDPAHDNYYCPVLPAPINSLAGAQWQAIYQFMEYGKEHCPAAGVPAGRGEFKARRKQLHQQYKAGEHGIIYVTWWYLWHIFTLWSQPYWIAEWEQRTFVRVPLPLEVQEWLSPLPEDQWAKPSADFTAYKTKAEAAAKNGRSIIGSIND